VSWWKLVWHQLAIPKQAFILWLAVNNKLSTGVCMLGDLWVILVVYFVGVELKVETTFFSYVVSVKESGKNV